MKKDETVHIDRECTRDVEVHPSTGVGMWGGGGLSLKLRESESRDGVPLAMGAQRDWPRRIQA